MRIQLCLLIAIFSYLLLSCHDDRDLDRDAAFDLNDTIEISVKGQRYNDGYDFRIHFDSVTEDSRCPSNANCVWAGNAATKFNVVYSGKEHIVVLNTHGGTNFPKDTLLSDIRIILVALVPYPETVRTIKSDEYVARLVIRKED